MKVQASSYENSVLLCVLRLHHDVNRSISMNTASTPIPVSVSNELQGSEQTRLHGHWLTLARLAWVSSLILLLSLFVPLLPSYFALLHSLCTNASEFAPSLVAHCSPR